MLTGSPHPGVAKTSAVDKTNDLVARDSQSFPHLITQTLNHTTFNHADTQSLKHLLRHLISQPLNQKRFGGTLKSIVSTLNHSDI